MFNYLKQKYINIKNFNLKMNILKNTSENTSENTLENTSENTIENTSENTSENKIENTSECKIENKTEIINIINNKICNITDNDDVSEICLLQENMVDNKELLLNRNFFEIFDFFDESKRDIIQTFTFYHKIGIKIYFNFVPDILIGNFAYIKIEGIDLNLIHFTLNENCNILNFHITNMCYLSSVEIIIYLLSYIDKIVLLGEALGIKLNKLITIENRIKKMKYPVVEIKENDCIMSNRSLIMGKNIFDILSCVSTTKTEYIYNESDIQITICYEKKSLFTHMMTFNLNICNNKYTTLCFYFENETNYIIKEIYIMFDYPYAIEYVLNKIKHVDIGIKIIALALGVKMDYTSEELIQMEKYL